MLKIGAGALRPGVAPGVLFRQIDDAWGTYTLPYIQSESFLPVAVDFFSSVIRKVKATLRRGQTVITEAELAPTREANTFGPLVPGEYELDLRWQKVGAETCATIRRIGIGPVIAALGDSLTEGYWSRGYAMGPDLTAELFPAEAVSRDKRNFPQFAPTTRVHAPGINCWQSWMPELNDRLAAAWGHPVFIANEGWGGITAGAYLDMIRNDAGWQARIRTLNPTLWLLHFGVNEERALTDPGTYAIDLRRLLDHLREQYGAMPGQVFVAKPCYDYWPGAELILQAYCREIDRLYAEWRVRPGADFFAAYARDKARWYGDDPVHPNVAGMSYMAQLWAEAILRENPHGWAWFTSG